MEVIKLEKLPGLKQGKKWKVLEELMGVIHEGLTDWHEDELLDKIYPGTSSISAQTVLGDDVIDKLASCGEHIKTQAEMQKHVRWVMGFNENTGYSTVYSDMLLAKLQSIYTKFDDKAAADKAQLTELRAMPHTVDSTSFYATSTQSRHRQTEMATNSNDLQESDTGVLGSSQRGQVSARGAGHQRGRGRGQVSRPRGTRGRVSRLRGARAAQGMVGSHGSIQGVSSEGDDHH
jgi:hypothetical protein